VKAPQFTFPATVPSEGEHPFAVAGQGVRGESSYMLDASRPEGDPMYGIYIVDGYRKPHSVLSNHEAEITVHAALEAVTPALEDPTEAYALHKAIYEQMQDPAFARGIDEKTDFKMAARGFIQHIAESIQRGGRPAPVAQPAPLEPYYFNLYSRKIHDRSDYEVKDAISGFVNARDKRGLRLIISLAGEYGMKRERADELRQILWKIGPPTNQQELDEFLGVFKDYSFGRGYTAELTFDVLMWTGALAQSAVPLMEASVREDSRLQNSFDGAMRDIQNPGWRAQETARKRKALIEDYKTRYHAASAQLLTPAVYAAFKDDVPLFGDDLSKSPRYIYKLATESVFELQAKVEEQIDMLNAAAVDENVYLADSLQKLEKNLSYLEQFGDIPSKLEVKRIATEQWHTELRDDSNNFRRLITEKLAALHADPLANKILARKIGNVERRLTALGDPARYRGDQLSDLRSSYQTLSWSAENLSIPDMPERFARKWQRLQELLDPSALYQMLNELTAMTNNYDGSLAIMRDIFGTELAMYPFLIDKVDEELGQDDAQRVRDSLQSWEGLADMLIGGLEKRWLELAKLKAPSQDRTQRPGTSSNAGAGTGANTGGAQDQNASIRDRKGNDPFADLEMVSKPLPSFDEVRKQYRKLSRKYHPDLNPGDASAAERAIAINNAYGFLEVYYRDILQQKETGDQHAAKDLGIFVTLIIPVLASVNPWLGLISFLVFAPLLGMAIFKPRVLDHLYLRFTLALRRLPAWKMTSQPGPQSLAVEFSKSA
jgi:hypothetical protein